VADFLSRQDPAELNVFTFNQIHSNKNQSNDKHIYFLVNFPQPVVAVYGYAPVWQGDQVLARLGPQPTS
jgi:hypothetical protein